MENQKTLPQYEAEKETEIYQKAQLFCFAYNKVVMVQSVFIKDEVDTEKYKSWFLEAWEEYARRKQDLLTAIQNTLGGEK